MHTGGSFQKLDVKTTSPRSSGFLVHHVGGPVSDLPNFLYRKTPSNSARGAAVLPPHFSGNIDNTLQNTHVIE